MNSWGNQPPSAPAAVWPLHWRDEIAGALRRPGPSRLARGLGRSYGDVCLNNGGALLPTAALDRILHFDRESGRIAVEAGVTLGEILRVVSPQGWFLPVVPGSQFVTVGGAIANDVHGKDHPANGTFGRHVIELELVRSDREPSLCAPGDPLFAATVGGLGLTGIISRATLQLARIPGSAIEETTQAGDAIALMSEPREDFCVAWLAGHEDGRGIIGRGKFVSGALPPPRSLPGIPLPGGALHPVLLRSLNSARWALRPRGPRIRRIGYEPFFFPLDRIANWNAAYGNAGFFQHQCVIPRAAGADPIRELLRTVRRSDNASFVTVLKTFGTLESPGLLSFPREGLCLALDLPNRGSSTLALLDDLDRIVLAAGGRLYPAKDARMAPETFRAGYPKLDEFVRWIDPALSSSFWRRVFLER